MKLSDEVNKMLVKIHIAHVLLMAQYDEIEDIKNHHDLSMVGCEFKHYQDQLSVLNLVVDDNLTGEANKLENVLDRYIQHK